jgi:Domain of unknown function(DUF2779)
MRFRDVQAKRRVHAKSRRATCRTTSSARFPSAVRVHPLPVSRSTFGTICSCSEGVALATRDRGAWIVFAVRTHDLPVCRSHLRHICSRRRFAETVVAALKGTKWSIIVYSSYEKTRLTELARIFPDLARPVAGIVKRLSDPMPVVRDGLYHPGFEFSNSLKSVAPALCPDITYDDLDEIADGSAASMAFWLMASGRADATTSARLRRSLLAYCHRDTWALERLHQRLNVLAARQAAQETNGETSSSP